MKLLSLGLPDLSGVERGWGRIELSFEVDATEDGGGEGRVGWRKPPGPWEMEVMGGVALKVGMVSYQR